MLRKSLAVVITALGFLQANWASALGVGEFTINSALNQPLDAEIRINDANDLSNTQVLISLATLEDFENAGITRDFFLTNLRFDVQLDGNGTGIVKVTTREPVIEPYLNFLVEAKWPSGRLLREYTVLLDLPVFGESGSRTVKAPASRAPASTFSQAQSQQARPRPAAPTYRSGEDFVNRSESTATSQPVRREAYTQQRLSPGQEYRVQRDDTLWEIALSSKPGGASVQQAMVSIQRLNPSAFVNGNINRLKTGAILRLPTDSDVTVSNTQAVGDVANQNRAWRSGDDSQLASGAQLDATDGVVDSTENYESSDRLSIATSGESDKSSSGEGLADGEGGSGALRDELIAAEETLDKTRRDNEELKSRLSDLESKTATLQRLLDLKDDQLAALQDKAGETGEVDDAIQQEIDSLTETVDEELAAIDTSSEFDEADPGEIGSSETALAEQNDGTFDDIIEGEAEEGIDSSVDDLAAASDAATEAADSFDFGIDGIDTEAADNAQDTTVAAAPAPTPVPVPVVKPSLLDQILGNQLYLGGIGAALLALFGWLFMRRRRDADDTVMDDFDEPIVFETDEAFAEPNIDEITNDLAGTSVETNDLIDTESADHLIAELEEEIAGDNAVVAETTTEEVEQLVDSTVESETGDAVAEADIYVAYGRYQQAIDLLRSSIQKEPQRSDLQVKLLEVYLETRDKPAFQQQYSNLQALGDDNAVVEVKEMLSSVDGVEGWLDGLPAVEQTLSDAEMDADLLAGSVEEAEQLADEDIELDLDFDLELDDNDDLLLDDAELTLDKTQEIASVDEPPSLSLVDSVDEEVGTIDLEDSNSDDLFDLDLDDEGGDLDLNLGGDELLESADLGDLEVEFGSATDEASGSVTEEMSDLAAALDSDEGISTDDVAALSINDEELNLDFADLDIDLDDASSVTNAAESAVESTVDTLEPATLTDTGSAAIAESVDEAGSLVADAVEDDDFDFLADTDEVATKLDLARAYIDMGDTEGAKDILEEVIQEGSDEQQQEANGLMERI